MPEKGDQPTEEEEEIKIEKKQEKFILPPLEQKEVEELLVDMVDMVEEEQAVEELVHQNLALKKEELGNKFKNINTQHLIWILMLIQIFGATLFLKDRK